MKLSKKIRRFLVRLVLFIVVYIGIIRNLLFQHNIFRSGIFLISSVVILLFLVIDFKHFSKKYLWTGIGVFILIGFVIFLLTVRVNISTILAYILLNMGFIVLIYGKDLTIFNAWKFFTSGGYLFSLFIALAYSFFIIGTRENYMVDCEKMYGSVNAITERIEKSGSSPQNSLTTDQSLERVQDTHKKSTVRNKFLDNSEEVLNDVGLSMNPVRDRGNQILVEVKEVGNDVLDSTKGLWNKINDNRRALSVSACKYLGKQISFLYQNTYFQLAVVILLSLVFVGVIRFIFRIMTLVAYILFKILYLLGIYRTKKVEKLVDTID